MQSALVIVCETSGQWSAALRQVLRRTGRIEVADRLRTAAGLRQAGRLVEDSPGSLLAIEATAGSLAEVLGQLARCGRRYPGVPCVALYRSAPPAVRAALVEAGAKAVVTSLRGLAPVASLAASHLDASQPARGSVGEQIVADLPWADAAVEPI